MILSTFQPFSTKRRRHRCPRHQSARPVGFRENAFQQIKNQNHMYIYMQEYNVSIVMYLDKIFTTCVQLCLTNIVYICNVNNNAQKLKG